MFRYLLRNNLLWLTALLSIFVVGCQAIVEELPSYEETSIVDVGDMAPGFEIEALDGTVLRMPNGEPTLLILFSHTCPDCKRMMSDLQNELSNTALEYNIMAISRGGEKYEVEAFVAENNLQFRVAVDVDATIYYQYAKMYVPRCYVIDANGNVCFVTYEYQKGDIDSLLTQLNMLKL